MIKKYDTYIVTMLKDLYIAYINCEFEEMSADDMEIITEFECEFNSKGSHFSTRSIEEIDHLYCVDYGTGGSAYRLEITVYL